MTWSNVSSAVVDVVRAEVDWWNIARYTEFSGFWLTDEWKSVFEEEKVEPCSLSVYHKQSERVCCVLYVPNTVVIRCTNVYSHRQVKPNSSSKETFIKFSLGFQIRILSWKGGKQTRQSLYVLKWKQSFYACRSARQLCVERRGERERTYSYTIATPSAAVAERGI